jgi:hypothetical protein
MTPLRKLLLVCEVLGAVLIVGTSLGSAAAQEQGKPRKVLKLDVITVEGRIQKPQAFYILQRSNLNFGELEKTETFLPKIVQSVNQKPF